jgi:DNA-binding transcriptional LysR family regulator
MKALVTAALNDTVVVDYGNPTRPDTIAHIASLEEAMGVRLLRDGRLTDTGHVVVPWVQGIRAEWLLSAESGE